MRYNRISADCHLDLIWLPPDLFVSEAPKEINTSTSSSRICRPTSRAR